MAGAEEEGEVLERFLGPGLMGSEEEEAEAALSALVLASLRRLAMREA